MGTQNLIHRTFKRHSSKFLERTPVGNNKKQLDVFLKLKVEEALKYGKGIPLLSKNPQVLEDNYYTYNRELVIGHVTNIDNCYVEADILDHKLNVLTDDIVDMYVSSCVVVADRKDPFRNNDKLICFYLDGSAE